MTSEVPSGSEGRTFPGGFRFEPHGCFACGELNEHGLRLILHADAEGCWTELAIPKRFEGWDGVVHGGVVCTILDEVMAWAVIGGGTWGVTARLDAAFRKPIRVGQAIRAEGHVTVGRRRTFRASGRILDASSDEVLATGEGVFVAVPTDRLPALQARYRLRPGADA